MADMYPTRNDLISTAKNLPELVTQAELFDPTLASRLQGVSLAQAGTIWANISAMVVGWLVTRFALGWDAQTCALVSGLLAAGATAVAHWLANRPLLGNVVPTVSDGELVGAGAKPAPKPPADV